jgi:hypothetical protein
MSSVYRCNHCDTDLSKLPPMANIQPHLDGKCITKPEDQYEKDNGLNINRKEDIEEISRHLDNIMRSFGEGWWKGWRVGLIGGLILGSMWMWIAIEVWKL